MTLAVAVLSAAILLPNRLTVMRLETAALGATAVIAIGALWASTNRLRRQARRTEAVAVCAQEVGLAVDPSAVAGAVLEAVRQMFPAADFAGLLVFDHATEKLRPLDVAMVAGRVGPATGPVFEMAPGEGVAGKVFLTGEPRCWETAAEIAADHVGMREAVREQVQLITGGVRSGAAAPLKLSDRGVIGVLTVGSGSHARLFRGDDVVVLQGLAEQAAMGIERARMYTEQRAQALTDPLTGLANYRQLKNVLRQEVARARRAGGRVGVIFCDLDNFKQVNDWHGHHAGDGVLRLMARALKEELRAEDLAARYGGDEFVCVLPGADHDQAGRVVERITHCFSDLLAADEELRHITTFPSTGVAVFPDQGTSVEEIVAIADAALMKAKHSVPEGDKG